MIVYHGSTLEMTSIHGLILFVSVVMEIWNISGMTLS